MGVDFSDIMQRLVFVSYRLWNCASTKVIVAASDDIQFARTSLLDESDRNTACDRVVYARFNGRWMNLNHSRRLAGPDTWYLLFLIRWKMRIWHILSKTSMHDVWNRHSVNVISCEIGVECKPEVWNEVAGCTLRRISPNSIIKGQFHFTVRLALQSTSSLPGCWCEAES